MAKNDQVFNLNFLIAILKQCQIDSVVRGQLESPLKKLISYYYLPYRTLDNMSLQIKKEVSTEKSMEDQINNQIIDQICKEYDMIPWDSMAAALESSIEILSQENVEQSSEKTKGSLYKI